MLPREHRVRTWFFTTRKKPDFVIQKKNFTLKVYRNNQEKTKVAIIVPKKASNKAVVRNSIKRNMYRVFQGNLEMLQKRIYILYIHNNTDNLATDVNAVLQEKFLDK